MEPTGQSEKGNGYETVEEKDSTHNFSPPDLLVKSIPKTKTKEKPQSDDTFPNQEYEVHKSPDPQQPARMTIKQIIKQLILALVPKGDEKPETKDPTEESKHSLKHKLRRHFLLNPELDEAKYHGAMDDIMVEDFVYVDPDAQYECDKDCNRKERLIDFVSGSVAHVSEICVCQPFDTVKVKQQTFPHIYDSMAKCLLWTYRTDGIWRGLYAGTMPAMVASLAQNSILFVAYGSSQAAIATALEIDSTHELSVFGNGCAGSLAAFFASFALCPTELVKCKLQSAQEMKSYIYADGKVTTMTPYRLTKHILQYDGKSGRK